MIIRCPECTTGFQLPAEQVTAKGVKVRCSRCSHVFRIREGGDGEPEIFYRDGDNGESASSTSSSPLPGLDLKPKKSSIFGDLGGGGGDPFGGAFDDGEEDEPQTLELSAMELGGGEFEDEEDEVPSFAPPPAAAPPKRAVLPEPEEEEAGEESGFGDVEEQVDPSFGMEGPSFDAEAGKVVEPEEPKETVKPAVKKGGPKGKGRPSGAMGAPPTARAKKPEAPKPAPAAAVADGPPEAKKKKSAELEEEDFEAHKIGGSMGTKIVTVLLLLSLVVFGFLGVVAAKNDGFIDFKAFPEMLEVAFADGEYEPRPEWAVTPPPTVIRAPEAPLTVESVSGELINVGRNDQIFVVRGMVRNNEAESFNDVELRAMISTPEGRMRRQIGGPVGVDTPVSEFRSLRQVSDAMDLVREGSRQVEANGLVPFTLVFDDPPTSVRNGENYILKVELAGRHGGAAVAAQD